MNNNEAASTSAAKRLRFDSQRSSWWTFLT